MQWLMMMMMITLLMPLCRRLRALRRAGCEGQALRLYRRAAAGHGLLILLAMAGQEGILLLSGQLTWGNGLPLHLCSLMGLTALPALLTRGPLLHALVYLGVPGALLALLFPAVLPTPWPGLTAFFFHLMHAGLFLSPMLPLALGWRPAARGAWHAGAFLLAAGLLAGAANALTGGNYLFLAGPVSGTPLVWLAAGGAHLYRALLALLAGLLLAAEAFAVKLLQRKH